MTVTNITKDPEALTLTVDAEFDATPDRVWELWTDPRKLEKWWGPPSYPATFVDHDLSSGGRTFYFMTSPEGEKYYGRWEITSVTPGASFSYIDEFANTDGSANTELPATQGVVTVDERPGGGTIMRIVSTFASAEALQQVVEMGMEEGIRLAVGQIDALLAA